MSAISGKKTVTTAGTAEALGTQAVNGPLMVKALIGNTQHAYIGNDGAGDVASTNGIELAAGDAIVFDYVASLAHIYVDVQVNGEGVSWIMLSV